MQKWNSKLTDSTDNGGTAEVGVVGDILSPQRLIVALELGHPFQLASTAGPQLQGGGGQRKGKEGREEEEEEEEEDEEDEDG
ncbi:hypothetical protein ACJ72_08828 [Emergomyces africanus]|uniref:Uncharacterized protein n=1 Tax=Emergomyces africanus TaxID=1955775 RepID=A0A1B7NJ29_9EURO|nr:hypothetical protein ACJ72_08828 [Emergomyces africanus]